MDGDDPMRTSEGEFLVLSLTYLSPLYWMVTCIDTEKAQWMYIHLDFIHD